MYRLTPNMLQEFERSLREFHNLFDGNRCSGWQLEELIVKAIRSDNTASHHAIWKEGGHDIAADIVVRVNGNEHELQIKSGQIVSRGKCLQISGYRLGRFDGDLAGISNFLNQPRANINATPYKKLDGDTGRRHSYTFCYIDSSHLQGLGSTNWEKHGKQWIQTNAAGVKFSLRPTQSWQIWWDIPMALAEQARVIEIN